MLYPTGQVREQAAKLLRKALKGNDPAGPARQILELDPHCAFAYLLLGTKALSDGRHQEAEKHFWDGLAQQPCTHPFYLALADARRSQIAEEDQLTRDLCRLTYRKLWMSESIPTEMAHEYNKTFGDAAGVDFNQPGSFGALADAIDSKRSGPADPRLRPYLLLDMLQDQAGQGEVDEDLVGQIRRAAADMTPVLEGALHQWAHDNESVSPDALCLIVALLGEIAPVSALDNLLDASTASDPLLFIHSHWAIWRMAQRFPEAAMERFRARIPGANVSLRCGIAEQFSLVPKGHLSSLTALLLLNDFARIGGKVDADYLLSATVHILEMHGCLDEAKAAIRRCRPALPKLRQRDFDLVQLAGFVPRLVADSIATIDIEDVCLKRVLMDIEGEDPVDGDVDDEEDAIDRPVATGAVIDPLYGRLFDDVMGAAKAWDPRLKLARQAFELFYGPTPSRAPEELGFGKWYISDFRSRAGAETLVERYLREGGAKLAPRERALLESWRDSLFSVWEVQSVEPGRGVELKDLCGSDQMFVNDVSSSRSLVKFDCVLCRVERFEDKWDLGGDGMRVPRRIVGDLLGAVKREAKREGLSESAWVRANSHQMHRRVTELHAATGSGMPEVRNYEGDLLEFSHATYQILDENAALKGLRGCGEFDEQEAAGAGQESTEFAWLGESLGDGARRAYGRIEIRESRLRLECNSRKRLERGRKLVEKLAGAHLKHLGDSYESVGAAMKRRQTTGGSDTEPSKPVPPELARTVIAQYKERQYATWPDQPLPGLGGKSPREAIRTKPGRRAVAGMLRDMENAELRTEKIAPFDFSQLRASLGLGDNE